MQESISKDKNKLKIFSSLLIIVLLIMGVSFAVFQNFARQSGTNNLGATNCFSVTFEGVNNAINLANDYPIPDSEDLERDPYTFKVTNNCNQYLSLSIGVETLSTSEIPSNLIKGVIVKNGGIPTTAMLLSSGKTMEAQNGGTAYELLTDGLGANSSKTYDLRLWFDESMTKEQGASKKYQGKVIVGASADVQGSRYLREAILAENEVKEPLTIPGKEGSIHTLDEITTIETESVDSDEQAYYVTYGTGYEINGTKFNLTGAAVTSDTYANSYSSLVGKYLPYRSLSSSGSSTAGTMKTTTNLSWVYYVVSATQDSFTYKEVDLSTRNISEALLASTEDDYGMSYYFRGNVKNNYVEFANKCWRIVRIVGDGSVKLVLHNDNVNKVENPCLSSNNSDEAAFAHYDGSTYTSAFNLNWSDVAYVGFMYGTVPGCENHPEITDIDSCAHSGYTWISSNSYADAHANINKSTILTNLETWYKNNLLLYEDKLADIIWCNDKNYISNSINFAALVRVDRNESPSLICPNDNNGGKLSKYTVSDTINGNGSLTYKVGLLTADEIAFAGLRRYSPTNNIDYLYKPIMYLNENIGTYEYWTMSPSFFNNPGGDHSDGDGLHIITAHQEGISVVGYVEFPRGVRPSISLVSSIKVTGSGTSEDPYKVV